MKRHIFLIIGLFLAAALFAGKVVPLPDLLKPVTIAVDDSQMYITEGTSIYIYKLADFSLVKTFGKEGEGPREFRVLPQLPLILNISGEELIVNSLAKVSYFTKSGEFLREEKVKGGFVFNLLPFGDRLAGQGVSQEENIRYRSINIYDQQLNKLHEVCKKKDGFQLGQGMDIGQTFINHQTIKDRLYVSVKPDFIIDVYDSDGKALEPITLDYERVAVDEESRQDVVEFFKTDQSTKDFFELFQPLRFPDYWPAIIAMFSADDKLYVMTFREQDDKNEFIVFDARGKLLERSFIPLQDQNPIQPYPFAIKNDVLYQLVDNIDTEEWELHINPLK